MSRDVPEPSRVEAALRRWLETHGLASYDPYDGLACRAPWSLVRTHPLAARLWTQAVKRSPFNLRPLIGVRPQVHSKSLADLALVELLRNRIEGSADALAAARRFLAALRTQALPGRSGACWGTPMPYVSRYVVSKAGEPNLFWTICAASAFVEAWEQAGDPADLALARSATDFIRHDLGFVDEGDGGAWVRYFAGHDAAVYNVAALTGALLFRLARHTGETALADLAHRAFRFVLRGQNPDGSWYYARGTLGRWVDGFHTGYILDSLLQAWLLQGDPELESALRRGVAFYHDRMFTADHLPRYLAERTYPIEVQNCAQAIHTLSNLCWADPAAFPRARAVALAVTQALFRTTRSGPDAAGYFVLSRGRWFTNRLAAVRWGQAPMLLALTSLRAAENAVRPSWEIAPRAPAGSR